VIIIGRRCNGRASPDRSQRRQRRSDEAGVGLLSSSLGLVMLFGLLLIALHTMLALQTRTLVNAAAWDAARELAKPGVELDQTLAESRVNNVVAKLNPKVSVRTDGEYITVTVSATSPGLLPGVTEGNDLRRVRRSATVRKERLIE
jgi:Flp pilus assembly protein TadG